MWPNSGTDREVYLLLNLEEFADFKVESEKEFFFLNTSMSYTHPPPSLLGDLVWFGFGGPGVIFSSNVLRDKIPDHATHRI